MRSYIRRILDIQKSAGKGGIILRRRLLLYLIIMAAALLGCTLLFLFSLNVASPGDKAASDLFDGLEHYEERLAMYFGNTAARGIHLSTLAAKEVERTLAEHEAAFEDVSDNPRLITALERNTFDILRNSLLITDCSGAFIIFDATVNTSLPGSADSRCGLCLKLANINVSKPINPDILWTRGTHEVGLENKLIFHNKWELEFAIQRTPFYRMVLEHASKNLKERYYYSPVMRLHGTWERIMLLMVPIVGKNGRVYGVCGFEISAIFFKLMHPVNAGRSGRMTGLIAPMQGDAVLPGAGLEAGTASGYFAELGNGGLRTKSTGGLTTFTLEDGREFVGVYKEISLSPLSGNDAAPWVVARFMPREDYTNAIYKNYMKILLSCVALFAVAGALCWYSNRKCVAPLVSGIDAIKSGAAQRTNIHEIDALLEFMANNALGTDILGDDIDISAFHAFKQNISTLSRAEKNVLDLYMQGHSAREIAVMLHVSINTIKSHNKSIFRKLNVPSRKALMVYVKMMKRAQE